MRRITRALSFRFSPVTSEMVILSGAGQIHKRLAALVTGKAQDRTDTRHRHRTKIGFGVGAAWQRLGRGR